MKSAINENRQLVTLDRFILLISGVPGSGKTTISYEILKRYNSFRIIQETDLIREILRGYNDYLSKNCNLFEGRRISNIPDHRKMFSYMELKEQCSIMKDSIENIILRQRRKGIPTIINGVHIVPEVLNGMVQNENVAYVNLFIDRKDMLAKRWVNRDVNKYMPYLDDSFEANLLLCKSTLELSNTDPSTFYNINVTNLSVDQTVDRIIGFIINNYS